VSGAGASWSTNQLAEFLAAVSASADVAGARQGAVERAAEAFGADVGAIVADGVALASIGFPRAAVPHPALASAADGGTIEVATFTDGDAPRALAWAPTTDATRRAGIAGDLFVVVTRRGAWSLNEIVRITGPFDDLVRTGSPAR
jgi:hypothetical protein